MKIRLVNDMDQDHPMHHPFHVHGAGRFLVLARDGEPDDNLVWKDTVLVRAGETVDILLDVTNPGLWMAHCHIAEHNQSGMMFSFRVTGRGLAMSAAWTNPAVAVQTAAATDVTGPASSRDLAPCAAFSDPSPRLRRHHSRCAATTHLLTEADMTTPKEVAR